MSDQDQDTAVVQDELTTLKARANTLGLTYHPSIGLEKLREKVLAAISGDAPAPAAEVEKAEEVAETKGEQRLRLKREAQALIRIRVTCMNPAKAEWDGEIFTAGNSAVGSMTKFIPFNVEEGWHVPNIIYQQLKDRQCQIFVTKKDSRGNKVRQGKLIKEFAIEVMDALTEKELAELARRQAVAKAVD